MIRGVYGVLDPEDSEPQHRSKVLKSLLPNIKRVINIKWVINRFPVVHSKY